MIKSILKLILKYQPWFKNYKRNFDKKIICILGASFKENSDDTEKVEQ